MKKTFIIFSVMGLTAVCLNSCYMVMPITSVDSPNAPKAIGPYSQATVIANMVYCSGQIGLLAVSGALVSDDISAQTRQGLDNLKAVLFAAHSDIRRVVKMTIYLKDMSDFSKVNEIYESYFPDLKPARSTVEVARLPRDALIEIDCVASVLRTK